MKLTQQDIKNLPTITLSSRMKNLTGTKKGRLNFLFPAENNNGRIYWWVQCECGEIEKVRGDTTKIECNICSQITKSKNLKGKKMMDLTNQRFGKLIALYPTEKRDYGKIIWHCKCDCGEECEVAASNLFNEHTQSCGCLKKIAAKNMGKDNKKDLQGQRFGYLLVLAPTEKRAGTSIIWECKCDCGKIHYVSSSDLINEKVRSCGCQQYNKEQYAIGMIGKIFGKLTVLEKAGKNTDGSYNYLCQCDCGNQKIVNGILLRKGITQSCGCLSSKGESKIRKILQEANIEFMAEKTFKSCYFTDSKALARFDFYINQKYLIEFDGIQHFEISSGWNTKEQFQKTQEHDAYKNQWCKDNNIPLIRIPYTKLDTLCLEDLLLETTQFRVV